MIEMRDGRKPVISPQLKSILNYIEVSLDDVREACEAAFKIIPERRMLLSSILILMVIR